MSVRKVSCIAVLLVVAASGALAADKVDEKRVGADAADTPAKFAQVIEQLHQEMAPGGRYEFIRPDDKVKVDADLQSMNAMLAKSGSVAAMSQPEKVQLFNTQEHLNGILTHSDRNRLICEHKPPIGTNIAVTSCKTVAEIEKMRRDGQKMATDQISNGWKCVGGKAGTGCAAKGG
jgi:hypothetical protein